ncbi:AI-2E family transporter [Ochrovirga pacifica]|uniref:AI-2E family transporter n=1 Tax=Ochrovirga pacifica TaxID=1042376 RepID=UPI0002559229|nr:AI-2E family transporter [Ochrovirga pacifica]
MKIIAPSIIRQLFILLLILTTGGLIFSKMTPYLSGVLGAITLYVILSKGMHLLTKKGWKKHWSATALLALSFVAILLPILGVFFMLSEKIKNISKNSDQIIDEVKQKLDATKQYIGYDVTEFINTSEVSSWLSENLQSWIGGTFNTAMVIFIMYFLLYYMLINFQHLNTSIYNYLPLKRKNFSLLEKEINAMVKANALGIPLVAVAQGLVALVGFFIFNIENPFFWAVVVAIGSMIPFIGSMLGTLPVFALTFSSGDVFNAWGILVYGIVFVGATDNIIRLYVLNKLDDVHPLITLLGVLIGIPLFGFIGLVFGPLLVSIFFVMVRIYKNEYSSSDSKTAT